MLVSALRYVSVVEYLPSLHKILGFITSTGKATMTKWE